MAVSYKTQKCTSCASTKLEYDKETKLWRCMYCGAVIERHEEVDTLFTIKNVVRQALVDLAYTRLDAARNNLIECEKIDSKYVGTVIANIAFHLNSVIYGKLNPSDQKNSMAQLKKYYMQLRDLGEDPTEEELALYEFFDSSEAAGVLILAYDSLGAAKRRDALFDFFAPAEVYSQPLNSALLNFSLKSGRLEVFDAVMANTANINVPSVSRIVMDKYPDGEQKCVNLAKLLESGELKAEEDQQAFTAYLDNSPDSPATKYAVASACLDASMKIPVATLMRAVVSKLNDEAQVRELVDRILRRHLVDTEVCTLVEFAVNECPSSVCAYVLRRLKETNQFVDLSYKHFTAILKKDCPAAERREILEAAMQFNVPPKTRELFIAEYLCTGFDTPQERMDLLTYLLGLISTLSTQSVEKYVCAVSFDAELKPEIVKKLFGMQINRSFFRNTLSAYLETTSDAPGVVKEITPLLLSYGLPVSGASVVKFILSGRFDQGTVVEVLRRVKAAGVPTQEIFNSYVASVRLNNFDSAVFQELLSWQTSVTDQTLRTYVLTVRDLSAAKASATAKMVGMCTSDVSLPRTTVNVRGETVTCSLAQAYLLLTPDDEATASAVLSALATNKNALSNEVTAGGKRKKFKKYLNEVRSSLGPVSVKLCDAFV